jgi:endonuclease/exonuclease/phosphatase (EEP) superfamily protein YafD
MFEPSQLHHSACHDHCREYIPQDFGVLCWNVHKNNHSDPKFQDFLIQEVQEKAVDIILFQEASFRDDQHFDLPAFSYDAAANLEYKKEFYGVLTASKTESKHAEAFLSEGKESLWGPHKSLLLSTYSFEDGTTLLILNVHAINFRENQRYGKELKRFLTLLERYEGPMILAGDFNSWNLARTIQLRKTAEELSLTAVNFENTGKVKTFMGRDLDFIFYRGLEALDAVVLDDHGLSDHNPLFVKFKRKR